MHSRAAFLGGMQFRAPSDAHANADGYHDTITHAHTDSYADSHAHAHVDSNSHVHSHTYAYADGHACSPDPNERGRREPWRRSRGRKQFRDSSSHRRVQHDGGDRERE